MPGKLVAKEENMQTDEVTVCLPAPVMQNTTPYDGSTKRKLIGDSANKHEEQLAAVETLFGDRRIADVSKSGSRVARTDSCLR